MAQMETTIEGWYIPGKKSLALTSCHVDTHPITGLFSPQLHRKYDTYFHTAPELPAESQFQIKAGLSSK